MSLSRFRLALLAGLFSCDIGAQPLTSEPAEHSVGVALRVFGGGECIRRPVLAEEVESWLGTSVLPATWTVVVAVEADTFRFSVYERGKLLALRRFEAMSADCGDREKVLGASIALSLEALLARRAEAEQERAELALALAEAEPVDVEVPEGSPLSSSFHVIFAPATLTSPALGGALAFEFGTFPSEDGHTPWRTRLGVMTLWSEDLPLSAVEDARLATRLFAARLGQCWGRGTRTYRLQGCSELLGGYVSGRGLGELTELGAHLPWVAWGFGVEGRFWLVEPVALSLGAQANVQLVRPRFRVVSDSGYAVEEFRAPSLGLMFHAGVTWSYR